MLIDQFGVFFDQNYLDESAISPTIDIMPYMGRGEHRIITVNTMGGTVADYIAIWLEESVDNIAFSKVVEYVYTMNINQLAFSLPLDIKGKYVRIQYFANPTSKISLFAGFTRSHLAPYAKGQYINAGRVVH